MHATPSSPAARSCTPLQCFVLDGVKGCLLPPLLVCACPCTPACPSTPAPLQCRMKDDIKGYLSSVGVDWEEVDDLAAVRA